MAVKYKTHPTLALHFRILDEILEIIAMRFLDVYSHYWHWRNIPYSSEFDKYGITLKGAPYGNPHNNPFFGVIAHLGGRPFGYVVEAEDYKDGYFIAFKFKGSNHLRRCNIVLREPVMLLTGPDNGCLAFAMDKNGKPLKLRKLTEMIHRKDKPAGIRIL